MSIYNNFKSFEHILEFPQEDPVFYTVRILRRKKENPEYKSTTQIKVFYVHNLEYYYKIEERVHRYCNEFNARAYIDLRGFRLHKVAPYMMRTVATDLINDNHKALQNAYDRCLERVPKLRKLFIIDVDTKDQDTLLKAIKAPDREDPAAFTVETPNGYHVIRKPFRTDVIKLPEQCEVKKHGLTLLYYNEKNSI